MSALSRRHFLALSAAALACPPARAETPAVSAASLAPTYPLTGGDAWEAFKAYDPAGNPDAPFYRSRVRRAPRIRAFAATQAHPGLDAAVPAATLVAAYLTLDGSDVDLNRTRAAVATPHRVHIERAWQYQDIVVGWNSTGAVPNPALVDVAHRNGALCLGTLFQPDKRLFDGSDLPRAEVAGKLVALAAWFGFDGYFVNFESYTAEDARGVQDLIAEMHQAAARAGLADFHIQYYDGYTDPHSVWPGAPHADGRPRESGAPRADSMMVDQGWSRYGLTHGCCSGLPLPALPATGDPQSGYDPLKIYYGLQLYPGPGYLGLAAPMVIPPNGHGKALGGLQIYSAEDGLRKMRRARLDQLKASTTLSGAEAAELAALGGPKPSRQAWYRLHDRFWSGQTGNPAQDNDPSPAQAELYGPPEARKIYTDYEAPGAPTDQLRLPMTYGVANFIAERSVIGAAPFVTHFNVGEGDRFFREGVAVGTDPWFSLGIQDILPTWNWWTRPLDGHRDADGLLEVGYDFDDAWDGGSSLRLSGTLATATEVRLFKTQVKLGHGDTLGLVGKGGKSGRLTVGLVFQDAPEVTEWVAVKAAGPLHAGWWRWHLDLGAYAGRTLAVLSLGVAPRTSTATPYDLRIGQLSLVAAPATSASTPQDFRVADRHMAPDGQSAELRMQWRFDPAVDHYDLLAVNGATRTWLGRVTGDAYHVAALQRPPGAATTMLALVPATAGVSSEAKAAQLVFAWPA
jgi:endo-beta-N-acetylglucosaminidase D